VPDHRQHYLLAVADAIALSRRTLRIIRGNLFWAFGYNAAAIPLAALGFLNSLRTAVSRTGCTWSVIPLAAKWRWTWRCWLPPASGLLRRHCRLPGAAHMSPFIDPAALAGLIQGN
jgi:hypothetical protein